MSAGVWYGKRTWLGLGFALVLALALDALGALLLARGMVPMAAARAWTLGSWAAGRSRRRSGWGCTGLSGRSGSPRGRRRAFAGM